MNVKETIESQPNVIIQLTAADLKQYALEVAAEARRLAIKDTQNFMAEKLLSGKEAAEMCGVQFSTFWRWVKQGKIPQMKGAGNPRYRLSDIQKLMMRGKNSNT